MTYFASTHEGRGRIHPDDAFEVTVTVEASGWSGGTYEWGVVGSDEVRGDALDPSVSPPERIDTHDTDGATAIWVRDCTWTARQVVAA